ncbi:TonB-dependent receptor [Flavobacteriaceae bacterium]|uniref:TonB-dependent receptor n=1 Tax=Candidatus Arcticimaribacter forsetii TaxID=2820661 RepID=UPI00207712A9|nr:carboxypeptidase-like regulatory domain-containing protein [Candidatus Arcticimaribacter forsetii]MDA8698938.1 TonB-dependent receptor [Flavobacteriaceae bacterium]MDB2328958.1 TonB-dependent receptor [Flavobacteriaceae bacterium]MDB2345257.1 TonB-dependent receptor [Flavobacteriaceae bacterium]MDB2456264.1 TonB-dependent receptor [Flavobacteriaceae bacterium]MDB4642860.1 TonB-dependent receptor [Flavobacteriaceae bacterium]
MKYTYILLFFMGWSASAQQLLNGQIKIEESGIEMPIGGANLIWLDTTVGAITNEQGEFEIPMNSNSNQLIISYIGFKTDTLKISTAKKLIHTLLPNTEDVLDEVTITQRRKAIQKSYLEAQNVILVSSEELLKAACCNLSESFETNPSVDVNFADALTGTKQIKMLGLSSPYLLISEENIPMVRGASQIYGLTFTPGTWIQSIQITKGAGSVVNGFESIAGQINTEIQKPSADAPIFVNAYVSLNGRKELNTHFNTKFNEKWSGGSYVHVNQRTQKFDANGDSFLDVPISKQINVLNRWQYTDATKGWVGFASLRFLDDEKQTGSMSFDPLIHKGSRDFWGSEIATQRMDASLKVGYVFPETPYQSFGFQSAYSNHDQESYFGLRAYDIEHKSFFTNLLFNSIISNTKNKFKTGINFSYDSYNEQVDLVNYERRDEVIGAFFEYSYDSLDKLNLTAGIRVDSHNRLGFFVTPRIHVRYNPWERSVLRASVGSGRKVANIFAENQKLFGTNRLIQVSDNGGSVYGLRPERAWNYGVSFRQGFTLFENQGDVTVDFYRTQFEDQVVVDWEQASHIRFYNLEGSSYANSFQLEVDYVPFKNTSLRLAYKNYEVKTTYGTQTLQKPLQPKERFFANFEYRFENEENGSQWKADWTYHFVGAQRLPSNSRDGSGFYSNSYGLLNMQLTRVFSNKFELYLGGENLGNFKQLNPIIGSENPFGTTFDSSLVYAPVFGKMFYAGLRFKLNN